MLAILGELCWLQFFKTVYLGTSNTGNPEQRYAIRIIPYITLSRCSTPSRSNASRLSVPSTRMGHLSARKAVPASVVLLCPLLRNSVSTVQQLPQHSRSGVQCLRSYTKNNYSVLRNYLNLMEFSNYNCKSNIYIKQIKYLHH